MALSFFSRIVEERIQEAQRAGEFDNLPGRGRPLVIEDDSIVPEDLRMAYRILKNANCLPPQMELRREILSLEDLIATIDDGHERRRLARRLSLKVMELNLMHPAATIPLEVARGRRRG